MMKYKGYSGLVSYDYEAKLFHGEAMNLCDIVTFQGTTIEEACQAFRDSIDDYLEWIGMELKK